MEHGQGGSTLVLWDQHLRFQVLLRLSRFNIILKVCKNEGVGPLIQLYYPPRTLLPREHLEEFWSFKIHITDGFLFLTK